MTEKPLTCVVLTGFFVLYGAVLCGASFSAYAEGSNIDKEQADILPVPLANEPPVRQDLPSAQQGAVLAPATNGSSLAAMTRRIDQSIKQKQWQRLAEVLAVYEVHPKADPYLVLYAKGILYRQNRNYDAAIAAYLALLKGQPELPYVRLDLGLMQAEDKQYADAIETLEALNNDPKTPLAVRKLAQNFLGNLRGIYKAKLRFGLSYTRNDNVNQASAERTISLGGIVFTKNENSLPKVGHGFNYNLHWNKQLPLHGHHGILLSARYSGLYYWDQKDYNEHVLNFSPAYLYQSYPQWLKLGPVIEKNWLGDNPYGTRLGAKFEWGRKLFDKHTLIPSFEYAHKGYAQKNMEAYEGNSYLTDVTWVYQPKTNSTLWWGSDFMRDVLRASTESSSSAGLKLGGMHQFGGGFNVQANLRVARRDFDNEHNFFGYTRHDKDRSASMGLWHSKLRIFGITPKLVYRWREIKSNIPALYSRKSGGFMLEVVEFF